MLLNCGAGEDSWESLGLQGDTKDLKEILDPKGNQSWIFIGRTDIEAETQILEPPDAKNWLIGKDPDAGKDWGQEEKGMTEDEMVGGITDLMDTSLSKLQEMMKDREAGVAESDMTERLNWTELNWAVLLKMKGPG